MKHHIGALAFVALGAGQLYATTYTVGPVGGGYNFNSIQQAINSSTSGDTILVYPHTYQEFINFLGKNITLTSVSGPSATAIDVTAIQPPFPNPPFPAVVFGLGEGPTAVLRGFTIRGGSSSFGGGITCINNSSPMIDGNVITRNGGAVGQGNGGGIYCSQSAPTITNNWITQNFGQLGAGIYSDASSPVIINNVSIALNQASTDGGGIYATGGGSNTIQGNSIASNRALHGSGGGIVVEGATKAVILNNVISSNYAYPLGNPGGGGGIFCNGTGSITVDIIGNTISANHSETWDGGGIHCVGSSPFIYSNTIVANFADGYGGGINLDSASVATIEANTISAYNVALASGGGIAARHGSDAQIYQNTIAVNQAGHAGGGIYIADASPYTTYNLIDGNGIPTLAYGTTSHGGGIAVEADQAPPSSILPQIYNNTIVNNFAQQSGAGVYLYRCYAKLAKNTIDSNGVAVDTAGNPIYVTHGGGIDASSDSPTIDANLVFRNQAMPTGPGTTGGAGVALQGLDATATFTNNIVAKNWLHFGDGGGVWCSCPATGFVFTNNSISHNFNADSQSSPTMFGNGLGLFCAASLEIWNCIIRGDATHLPLDVGSGAAVNVYHSDLGPFVPATPPWNPVMAVISGVPRFVDPSMDNFHITNLSPCYNTGNNAAPGLPSQDIDLQARINGTVEMGADEVY